MNDHLDIYAAEVAALKPTEWERWIDRVKDLMGHDADGDLNEDGYSLDTFYDMYEADLTAEQASMRIVGAVCVDSEGTVYRLRQAEGAGIEYREEWQVLYRWNAQASRDLRAFGSESHIPFADPLPTSAVLVWAPDRDGVTAFAICTECGKSVQGSWLNTSEWRASALCLECLNGSIENLGSGHPDESDQRPESTGRSDDHV